MLQSGITLGGGVSVLPVFFKLFLSLRKAKKNFWFTSHSSLSVVAGVSGERFFVGDVTHTVNCK